MDERVIVALVKFLESLTMLANKASAAIDAEASATKT